MTGIALNTAAIPWRRQINLDEPRPVASFRVLSYPRQARSPFVGYFIRPHCLHPGTEEPDLMTAGSSGDMATSLARIRKDKRGYAVAQREQATAVKHPAVENNARRLVRSIAVLFGLEIMTNMIVIVRYKLLR
jgi:hypothetical protein